MGDTETHLLFSVDTVGGQFGPGTEEKGGKLARDQIHLILQGALGGGGGGGGGKDFSQQQYLCSTRQGKPYCPGGTQSYYTPHDTVFG